MRLRSLGSGGALVSEIGFGSWGIGGDVGGSVAYGATDDAESMRAVLRAVDAGVTFFDTSDLYGSGHSEELLGRAFRRLRGQVQIASKVGFVDANGAQDFSRVHILRSVEGSLRRLETDHLDLYQLHSPALEDLSGPHAPLETLEGLRREGKIRAVGVSVRSPSDGLAVVRSYPDVRAIQVNFNLVDQRAAEIGLIPECGRQGVGVIVRTPLCFGFLAGGYGAVDQFGESDHRRRWPPEQLKRWAEAFELFTAALDGPAAQTPAQLALRFCLSYPGVSTVIPGMLTAAQVDENVTAGDLPSFSPAELSLLEAVYRANTFFVK